MPASGGTPTDAGRFHEGLETQRNTDLGVSATRKWRNDADTRGRRNRRPGQPDLPLLRSSAGRTVVPGLQGRRRTQPGWLRVSVPRMRSSHQGRKTLQQLRDGSGSVRQCHDDQRPSGRCPAGLCDGDRCGSSPWPTPTIRTTPFRPGTCTPPCATPATPMPWSPNARSPYPQREEHPLRWTPPRAGDLPGRSDKSRSASGNRLAQEAGQEVRDRGRPLQTGEMTGPGQFKVPGVGQQTRQSGRDLPKIRQVVAAR